MVPITASVLVHYSLREHLQGTMSSDDEAAEEVSKAIYTVKTPCMSVLSLCLLDCRYISSSKVSSPSPVVVVDIAKSCFDTL